MRRLTKAEGDRGAIAVVVAGSATLLLLMAGAAVDVGASIAKRTELQNGADAAALALAQDIAPGVCTEPVSGAITWVQQNVRNNSDEATAAATCPAVNQVRVAATATQEHWFLPVVGRPESEIGADATAAWGVPIGGPSALPIAMSQCSFSERVDGIDTPIGGKIEIWMDHPNDPFGDDCHADYPPGGFGWTHSPTGCYSEVRPDYTVDPPIGWVRVGNTGTGTPQPGICVSDNSFKRAVDSGEPVLIPIFDGPAVGTGANAEYPIARFASFLLEGYDIHNSLGKYQADLCNTVPSGASPSLKTCLEGRFLEYVDFADGMDLRPPGPGDNAFLIELID